MNVEKLAVDYLDDLFSHTSQLEPHFNSGDKEPVWDGFVYVYKDHGSQHKKENLLRRVPVQIKGTQQKLVRDGDGVRFQLEVADLRAYLTERPTAFFVVWMDENGNNRKPYYRVFAKADAAEILNAIKSGGKTVKLSFTPLPTKPDELEALFLQLAREETRPPDAASVTDPYLYNAGTVAFRGRDEEFKALDAFLGAPERFRWWGVAAAGGAGKTRLAHEWRKQAAERGWVVLWPKGDDYDDLKRWNDPAERLLLIADYAWQHVEALGKWMDALCQKEPFQKVRVLLLERDTGEEGGEYPWEKQLYQAGNEAYLRCARHDKMLRLAALDDGALQGLMRDFAAPLQAREPELSALPAGEEKRLLAWLGEIDELRRPLFAMLLTDAALRGAGVPDSREALLERIVERERAQRLKRIPTLSPTPPQKRALERISTELRLLATALGAGGDISAERLAALLPEDWKQLTDCAEQLGLSSPEELLLDLGLLRVADGALRVPALRPDLLGEYALLRALRDCGATQIKRRDALYAAALGDGDLLRQFVERLLNDYSALLNSKPELWARLFPELPKPELSHAAAYSNLLYDAFYRCTNWEQRLVLLANMEHIAAGIRDETADAGTVYNNLGLLYLDLGDDDKALFFLSKFRIIAESAFGDNSPYTASCYNNLGMIYLSNDNLPMAAKHHEKALEIRVKALGAEHAKTAQSYNNMGLVYHAMGELSKALEYFDRALSIWIKRVGAEHPDTATAHNNMGTVYRAKGELSKSLESHNKALAIRKKVLGLEHPLTATSYNNLGAVYQEMGDHSKALECYKNALLIDEKVFGTEHPNIARDCYNLSFLYEESDITDALRYAERALNIMENAHNAEHKHTKLAKKQVDHLKEAQP